VRRVDVRWGYRTPSGATTTVSEREANEGYMSAEQYAKLRASVVGGQLVRQTVTTETSEWEPVP